MEKIYIYKIFLKIEQHLLFIKQNFITFYLPFPRLFHRESSSSSSSSSSLFQIETHTHIDTHTHTFKIPAKNGKSPEQQPRTGMEHNALANTISQQPLFPALKTPRRCVPANSPFDGREIFPKIGCKFLKLAFFFKRNTKEDPSNNFNRRSIIFISKLIEDKIKEKEKIVWLSLI